MLTRERAIGSFCPLKFPRREEIMEGAPAQLVGTPCALNWNASVGEKDPGQKQEGGKAYQGNQKRAGVLAGPAGKIRFKTVPKLLPPRDLWRRTVKMKMRHENVSARPGPRN